MNGTGRIFIVISLLLCRLSAQEVHAVPPPDPVPNPGSAKPSGATDGASTVKEVVEVIQQTAEEMLNHSKALYHEISRREKVREQRHAEEASAPLPETVSGQNGPGLVERMHSAPLASAAPPAGPVPAAHAEGARSSPGYHQDNSTNSSIESRLQYAAPGSVADGAHMFVDVNVPGLGTVRGQSAASRPSAGVDRWLGLPFALPPTGSLRWMPPVPLRTWKQREVEALYNTSTPLKADGTAQGGPPLDGTRFGHSCMPAPGAGTWMPPEPSISEDCLFLNVWAPVGHTEAVREGRASLLPVVLWIHGGAFFMGSGANPSTSPPPDVFVRAANVIYVTFNYRLGVLGWLVSSALPGNGGLQGIQDQLLAMEWVRDNIRAFGGDPSQVTLQGESAGAISICIHLALPAAKGLFKKAILQSGICAFPFEDAATAYAGKERLSKAVGCHRAVANDDAAAGTDMRPARPPPVNVITKPLPLATAASTRSGSGGGTSLPSLEGGKAVLEDSLVQLPVEREGTSQSSGAAGAKVEQQADELAEERQKGGTAGAGAAPGLTSWQGVSIWVRSSNLWPWSMTGKKETQAASAAAHTEEASMHARGSGSDGPTEIEQPATSIAHSLGSKLWDMGSNLASSRWRSSAQGDQAEAGTPEGLPVDNLQHFLKPATAKPYSTLRFVEDEGEKTLSLGKPRTWTAWFASMTSALSRTTANQAVRKQSVPLKHDHEQGNQNARVAYKPPVWGKKQLVRDAEELECMRSLSPQTMVSAMTARRGIFFYEGETWGPVVDGILLPDHPLRMIHSGMADVSGVDILYGHNKDEASVFVLFAWPFLVSRQLVWDFIHATLGPEHAQDVWSTYIEGETHPDVKAAMPAITSLPVPRTADGHPVVSPSPAAGSTTGKAEDTLRVKAVRMLNDFWKCASFSVAEQLSNHGARVRVYQFVHTPSYLSNWFQWLGAFHGAELDFALAAFTQHEPEPSEAKLAAHMARLWGEFVTGKRLKVQEIPGLPKHNSTSADGSSNETSAYSYTFVADSSAFASHPPLAVHPTNHPDKRQSHILADAILGKQAEPLLVNEAHVEPALIHVNDVEWPLYAPPGRAALSTEPPAAKVEGVATGHERGVCLQLQAEPSFTLSPRGTCRPAECTLWDATLSHGFIMRFPPQMKEPLVSRLTNVWVPKALAWLSKHLPHLNILGVVLVMLVLALAAWPAGRAVARRLRNKGLTLWHGKEAVPALTTTPYRWGLPANYGFRPPTQEKAESTSEQPGVSSSGPRGRVASFLRHVADDMQHLLPPHGHVHRHKQHTTGSVGVYGPVVDMEEFLEHCDDSECGDSDDDEGGMSGAGGPKPKGAVPGQKSARAKALAKLRKHIPRPLQEAHDLAQVEAATLTYVRSIAGVAWPVLRSLALVCWGFIAGTYDLLTHQCRRPRHRGTQRTATTPDQ